VGAVPCVQEPNGALGQAFLAPRRRSTGCAAGDKSGEQMQKERT